MLARGIPVSTDTALTLLGDQDGTLLDLAHGVRSDEGYIIPVALFSVVVSNLALACSGDTHFEFGPSRPRS